ncbi:nuclear transcription factor Y subunit A-10-like [Herrania umbratica]|uniref:Nuclear transcription factor Y subunit n=1 Tax=Herrania umbratica TaxID=108875 RepID=A0A6J1AR68_9ROSI|nr:nuclear transcription factor Y subunit A-10-like [Herrania umbratica]XP_021289352.1 nuclear transcription factor Y subunit A-10-like [Herrania umbratica]XP_021289353.1 nuclear transcription factor Y subunit A-10-like [Herrania umbratica]
MAMQTLYLKEHDGIVHNPMGQLASVPTLPWWSALGSQSVYGESCGQSKTLLMEHPSSGDQLTSTKQAGRATEQQLNKANPTQFTIFPGDFKNSGDGHKPQAVISLQSAPSEHHARFELGFRQPMVCAKYPYVDQCYGVFSTYGPQISGRVMLPLNMATEDGPIYVNAKQYNGIIRRRQSRAKAVLENKVTKARKPYMHYSRHLHAMRRPRGCGGRFLNTKSSNSGKDGIKMSKAAQGKLSHSAVSQNSEVLQSDSGTLNSSKEANGGGSTLSGSEVTSMYSRVDLEHFPINHLGLSVHTLPRMVDNGRGTVMPSKWVATGDNCCNLKV